MTGDRQSSTRRVRVPAVLFTGHPSAGKTTLATRTSALLSDRGIANEILDGDELRSRLPPLLGFSREDRSQQFARALFLAELLAAHGVVPILALVAPFAADRDIGRLRFAGPGWLEIHLDPPQQTCIERDTRGLYARLDAEGGRSAVVAEVFAVYEPPPSPALRLDTNCLDIGMAAATVLNALEPLLTS